MLRMMAARRRATQNIIPAYVTTSDEEALQSVTATVADISANIVWCTMINEGYIRFTQNFLLALEKNSIPMKLLIFCLDMNSYNTFVGKSNCIAIKYLQTNSPNLTIFGTNDYKQIVFRKLDVMKLMHAACDTFGYIDTDIYPISDPTPVFVDYMSRFPEVQVFSQCDEDTNMCQHPRSCPNICSGIIVFRKELPAHIFDYTNMDIRKYSSDQDCVSAAIDRNNVKRITLPKDVLLNGSYSTIRKGIKCVPPSSAVAVHFNWMKGPQKEPAMREQEMWLLPNEQRLIYKYHPFDGGFFANFNYMISMNNPDRLVIPYWTNKSIGKSPAQSQHYNYWGDTADENIFLRYFDILIDANIANLPTYNHLGPDYLTHPGPRNRLMHNKPEFTAMRHRYHTLYSRLFRPKQYIVNKVDAFMADKREAIAVHVRNPVHNVEARPLKFKDYFDAIAAVDDGVRPILLATDNELSLLVFKDKFGDRLKYFQESERASVDMHLDWVQALRKGREDATGLINGKGFELHNAKVTDKDIGYDVVYEMLCLQKAAVFIGSVSNVALVAGYMNPNIPMIIL